MTQRYLDQGDVDYWGHGGVGSIGRISETFLAPHLENLQAQQHELRKQLARERRVRLDAQVSELVPDWRSIDKNPAWHKWLVGVDPLSGRVRQILLNEAIDNSNARQVQEIFRQYMAQAGQPALGAPLTRTGHSRQGGRVYTRAEIKKIYDDHLRGAYQGRDVDWARQEADIIAASREGRILNPDNITK
jgi:hypothetical protein